MEEHGETVEYRQSQVHRVSGCLIHVTALELRQELIPCAWYCSVSNFSIKNLKVLLKEAKIVPAANQVGFS